MYYHFPTKRDLALAALERNVADLLPAASELDGPGDPMAILRHDRRSSRSTSRL
jgi:AcrR family transcriptional regulator